MAQVAFRPTAVPTHRSAVGGFFFYPLLDIIWQSFGGLAFDWSGYTRLIEGGPYIHVLERTFTIAGWVTLLSVLLAYPVAYFMAGASSRVTAVMSTLLMVPLFTAVLIRTYAWMIILGRRGVINTVLTYMGLIDQPVNFLFSSFGVYVGLINVLVPIAVFAMYSVMVQIDRNHLLAAQVLGADPVRAFLRVFFPLSMPGVLSASVLIFIIGVGIYITPVLLGRPQDTMISQLIISQVTNL